MVKFNFSRRYAAQDMLKSIMKEKSLSVQEAINFSINPGILLWNH